MGAIAPYPNVEPRLGPTNNNINVEIRIKTTKNVKMHTICSDNIPNVLLEKPCEEPSDIYTAESRLPIKGHDILIDMFL